jgi:hypothetical protein
MRDVREFLRGNPQAVVLLIICLVLGLGTFIVILVAIAGSGSHTVSGDPDGSSLGILHAAVGVIGGAVRGFHSGISALPPG